MIGDDLPAANLGYGEAPAIPYTLSQREYQLPVPLAFVGRDWLLGWAQDQALHLKCILADLPEDAHVERAGLTHRLEWVEAKVKELEAIPVPPKSWGERNGPLIALCIHAVGLLLLAFALAHNVLAR
jgi:hypothetical protein